MIHHVSPVEMDWSHGASIFFMGDWQHGAQGFDEEAYQEMKHEFLTTKNAYALGLGDYENWLRPSMRWQLIATMKKDDTAHKELDDKIRRSQDDLLDKMAFLEGRCIGLHSGHHEWDFADGTNSTQRICSALKAPYLGWMASTRLLLAPKNLKQHCWAYTVISLHGTGSARFSSTDARWLEANIVPAWVSDFYVKGHSCKSNVWTPFERGIIRRHGPAGVNTTAPKCMNVGGLSRGYTNGWESSYVERAGFLPQGVAWGVLRLKVVQRKENNLRSGLAIKHNKDHHSTPTLDVEAVTRGPGALMSNYEGGH